MVLPVDKEPRDPETTYSALEQEACLSILIPVIQIQIQHDSNPYQAHNPVKEMCRHKNMKERTAKEKQLRGGNSSDLSLQACSGRILYPGDTWVERIGAHQRNKNGFPRTPQRTKVEEEEK